MRILRQPSLTYLRYIIQNNSKLLCKYLYLLVVGRGPLQWSSLLNPSRAITLVTYRCINKWVSIVIRSVVPLVNVLYCFCLYSKRYFLFGGPRLISINYNINLSYLIRRMKINRLETPHRRDLIVTTYCYF